MAIRKRKTVSMLINSKDNNIDKNKEDKLIKVKVGEVRESRGWKYQELRIEV